MGAWTLSLAAAGLAWAGTSGHDWKTTASGLKYRIVEEGAGPKPTPQPTLVTFDYEGFMQIIVRDNNVDQALRRKKKLQREGVYREMKPPSLRSRARPRARRRRPPRPQLERKRLERDGSPR